VEELFSNSKRDFKSLSAGLGSLALGLMSKSAFAEKAFDDYPAEYSLDLSKAPMYTISGITDWGASIMKVYGITTWILVFVFLAVAVPCIYALFKFRATGNETELPKQVTGNHVLELLWTIIPVGLLLFIAVPTWEVIFQQDRDQRAAAVAENVLKIDAVGHQWWWEFKYTQLGVTTANELVLPADTPVLFTIKSNDVIHSFYIPRFGGKIDAIPGKENYLSYTTPKLVNKENAHGDIYQGHCLELCGLSHALMRFEVIVKSKEGFDAFIASHNTPPVVMTEREKRGEELFAQCMACHTIEGTPSAGIKVAKIGPNLSNFGSRRFLGAQTRKNNMVNLRAWIKNSGKIKPGSRMLPFEHLSDQELDDVAAYVQYSTAKEAK
jgi:cytochrome c oxidase subunit II